MATPKSNHPHHLTRKELRQPVEAVSIVDAIADYVANNLVRVVIGVVGLLVLVLVLVGVRFYLNAQERAVAEAFYQATTAYDHRDYGSARSQFAALAEAHPGTSLGRLAQFYIGNTFLTDKQPTKARDALQKYLTEDNQPAFREMALMQLGVANEELADFTAAQKAYQQAAEMRGPEQGRAELNVARLRARAGDKKGAIAAYQRYLSENPYSQERSRVVDALAQLGAAPLTASSAKTIDLPSTH